MHKSIQSLTNFSNIAQWHSRRIYFIGALGSIIEWYDFALYGILAHVFAIQFFSNISHSYALLMAYLVFFISYLAKPIGGLFYGLMGDHIGRKPALLLSIFMMTICMFIMALLPSQNTIGAFASILLLIFRTVQGFSVGGETTGSLIYVLESVESKRHGVYGACIWQMTWVGGFSATLVVVLLMHLLNSSQFTSWGWRLAYLIGGVAGLIIFTVRSMIPESIEFEQAQIEIQQYNQQSSSISWRNLLLQYWPIMLTMISLLAMPSVTDMFISLYFPQYIHHYFSIPLVSGWSLNIFVVPVGIISMIAFGALSDRISRKKLLIAGASCILLLSYPLLSLLTIGQWRTAIIISLLFVLMSAMYSCSLPALLVKMPRLTVRYRVFSLGYNIATSLFCGSALLICSFLTRLSPLAPAFYFMTLATISLIALYFINKRQTIQNIPFSTTEEYLNASK